ncbi:hypothetical protein H257_11383 [Aphanomyces astaci]|uniref:Uncharacterized protein n=1 Tax=Aphanomyces astaci TaxID=112090 RepID=W4G304_APHAT|nr:hypothetical protein H257_11383 [Aphanomyces astaci]ETV74072.1 hypothetical protein H257_11383 [Aphanomyces astaci]|eukprot:XP_009836585.1 hypothetical protein H257_11383 [Aphanomyces astaci]
MTRVIPAIKACFPSMNKHVVLQHDNATLHRVITDEVLACVSTDGWTFVDSLLPSKRCDISLRVIRATLAAFALFESDKLVDAFLTLQAVMRLVLENNGGNQLRLPHLGKKALRRRETHDQRVLSISSSLGYQ